MSRALVVTGTDTGIGKTLFAGALDGVTIDPTRLTRPASDRPLIIEGAGRALVPLTRDLVFANMFTRWAPPVVIVARTSLGTINHSPLSIEARRARSIRIFGIAFIGEANEESVTPKKPAVLPYAWAGTGLKCGPL